MVDLAKLNGVIVEKSKAKKINLKKIIASDLHISLQALGKKLNGKSKIFVDEVEVFVRVLELTDCETLTIFLVLPSQKRDEKV